MLERLGDAVNETTNDVREREMDGKVCVDRKNSLGVDLGTSSIDNGRECTFLSVTKLLRLEFCKISVNLAESVVKVLKLPCKILRIENSNKRLQQLCSSFMHFTVAMNKS